jgi:hypothetical protein
MSELWATIQHKHQREQKGRCRSKDGGEGKIKKASNLPDYLKEDKLPLSTAAVKQEFEQKLRKRWKEKWEGSPRHAKVSRIDPSMPSNKCQHLIGGLKRSQASLVIQFRICHITPNQYLHCITKSKTLICPSCK